LLLAIAKHADASLKKDHALAQSLVTAWPVIWTWLQYFHKCMFEDPGFRNIRSSNAANSRYYHPLVTSVILSLINHPPSSGLRAIVCNTPGVMFMMGSSWAKEVTGLYQSSRFAASALLGMLIEDAEQGPINELISACGGSPADVVSMALQPIDTICLQAEDDYSSALNNLTIIIHCFDKPLLVETLSSTSGSVITMINLMTHLMSSACRASRVQQSDLLGMCVVFITYQATSSSGIHRVHEALDKGFLVVFLRCSKWYREIGSDYHQFQGLCVQILDDVLPKYLIHRPLLLKVLRCLNSIIDSQIRPGEQLEESWSKFLELVKERSESYNQYRRSPASFFVCGNPEVRHLAYVHSRSTDQKPLVWSNGT
jgi:hypothetical protein